jgi:hypothetical protein
MRSQSLMRRRSMLRPFRGRPMKLRPRIAALAACMLTIGLFGAASCAARKPAVTSLEDTLEPLREFFNANASRPRFVAIMSPT